LPPSGWLPRVASATQRTKIAWREAFQRKAVIRHNCCIKQDFTMKKYKFQKIAKERVNELFLQAEKAKTKTLANRYVALARKIGMKYKVRIPAAFQKRFCKHCYHYLTPGKNLRVRTQKGHLVYYCLECKGMMRFPYKE